ncbi:MAG: hypothetical protein H0Z33_05345 [Bacillaceae bacterium]|nr:hypothetical protein [Bacillaceae bacterium]
MQKGTIPLLLGTAATLTGLSMLNEHVEERRGRPFAWGLAGFGLAHLILGTVYRNMDQHITTADDDLLDEIDY